MVERRVCSFCGGEIEPGTGRLYIQRDGNTMNFCSNKCTKNLLKLKRVPRETRWTRSFPRASAAAPAAGKKPVKTRKVRRTA